MATPPKPKSVAYQAGTSLAVLRWLELREYTWKMILASLASLQRISRLVILCGSIVNKKWVASSDFMALYAFAAVVLVIVICVFKFGYCYLHVHWPSG
ncbi:ammonium transporter 2 [Quercus suber]|uniref:Ammonium transporter 2 n=1 Tax=Quercus suber TaxID=58331 RepID=A0AAW0LXZ4_QUESU